MSSTTKKPVDIKPHSLDNPKLYKKLNKIKNAYRWEQYDKALQRVTELKPQVNNDTDPLLKIEFYCYHSLCILANGNSCESMRAALSENQTKLQALTKRHNGTDHFYHRAGITG